MNVLKTLRGCDRAVMDVIIACENAASKGRNPQPMSARYIAEEARYCKRMVQLSLAKLRQLGLIVSEQRKRWLGGGRFFTASRHWVSAFAKKLAIGLGLADQIKWQAKRRVMKEGGGSESRFTLRTRVIHMFYGKGDGDNVTVQTVLGEFNRDGLLKYAERTGKLPRLV